MFFLVRSNSIRERRTFTQCHIEPVQRPRVVCRTCVDRMRAADDDDDAIPSTLQRAVGAPAPSPFAPRAAAPQVVARVHDNPATGNYQSIGESRRAMQAFVFCRRSALSLASDAFTTEAAIMTSKSSYGELLDDSTLARRAHPPPSRSALLRSNYASTGVLVDDETLLRRAQPPVAAAVVEKPNQPQPMPRGPGMFAVRRVVPARRSVSPVNAPPSSPAGLLPRRAPSEPSVSTATASTSDNNNDINNDNINSNINNININNTSNNINNVNASSSVGDAAARRLLPAAAQLAS